MAIGSILSRGAKVLKGIPLIGSIPETAKGFGQAVKARKPIQMLHHGASLGAGVGVPLWIGSEVYKARKGVKMTGEELERLQKQSGFVKEAVNIPVGAFLKSILGTGKKAVKYVVKRPALPAGALLGVGALGTALSGKKALERSRRIYGTRKPQTRGIPYGQY